VGDFVGALLQPGPSRPWKKKKRSAVEEKREGHCPNEGKKGQGSYKTAIDRVRTATPKYGALRTSIRSKKGG